MTQYDERQRKTERVDAVLMTHDEGSRVRQ